MEQEQMFAIWNVQDESTGAGEWLCANGVPLLFATENAAKLTVCQLVLEDEYKIFPVEINKKGLVLKRRRG